MSLRDTFRRDQVFAPLRPGTRPVRPGQLDTGGKHILYMEDITVSFDGFKALNDLTLYI
ncbi:MAG TPA: ABC transporter ATP-binding protein, partial [Alcanivorax sp.]|nr:ABC transporter ATP-binding protein [Alcanivorax sp.]